MRYGLLALLSPVVMVSMVLAQEKVDNPAYQNWAKYQPGTSVTYSQQMAMGGMNMDMEMTQTLAEVTPEQATVEMSMKNSMMPNAQTQKMQIPAKVEKGQVQEPGKMPEGMKGEAKSLGKEKVTVSGKDYECEVTQFSGETKEGMKMEGKSWTTSEVPGQMVKMEMKGTGGQAEGMNMKMNLTQITTK